jgi:hypothetical protein
MPTCAIGPAKGDLKRYRLISLAAVSPDQLIWSGAERQGMKPHAL